MRVCAVVIVLTASLLVLFRAEARAQSAPVSPSYEQLLQWSIAGQRIYRMRCAACHALKPGGALLSGPHLDALIGRLAGSVVGYDYSPEHTASGLIFDAPTLDRYLADPLAVVPGTKMVNPVLNAGDRHALITYFRSQMPPPPPPPAPPADTRKKKKRS